MPTWRATAKRRSGRRRRASWGAGASPASHHGRSAAARDFATCGFGVLTLARDDRRADREKIILADVFNNRLDADTWLPQEHGDRRRAYQCLAVNSSSLGLVFVREPAPYLQSPEVNPVAGGISRAFRLVPEEHPATRITVRLAASFLQVTKAALRRDTDDFTYLIDVHYVRVLAPGNPCPEGVHSDGLVAGATHLVKLRNAGGGITHLYDRHGTILASRRLTGFLDAVIFDDRRVLHYTTPIRTREPFHGYRDVVLLGLREAQRYV